MEDFINNMERKLKSPSRERQLLSKFFHASEHQGEIIDQVPIPWIDKESCRRKIYEMINKMFSSNKAVNFLSIQANIELTVKDSEVDEMLSELKEIREVNWSDSVENIAESLHIAFQNRVIFYDIIEHSQKGLMMDSSPKDILDRIDKSLTNAKPPISQKSFAQSVKEVRDKFLKLKTEEKGLSTGISSLDETFGGVIKDRYWTIGAESGAGKTSFLINMLVSLCSLHRENIAICFFSMEMSENRIIERIISNRVSMSSSKLRGNEGELTEDEKTMVNQAYDEILDWPITLIYKEQTPESLKSAFQKFATENKGKHLIAMVDHIGKVEGIGDLRNVTIKASQACKSFCIDHGATVFVLTQLKKDLADSNNRIVKETFHKPNVSHIMESGSLRSDSDVVLLLWRPESRFDFIPINGMERSVKNSTFLICEKNRDGQSGFVIELKSRIEYCHYEHIEKPEFVTF